MGQPAAKQGDRIEASHSHTVQTPNGPVEQPFSFVGLLSSQLSTDVLIMGRPAAVVSSTAAGAPHVAAGGSFVTPPSNKGVITSGSPAVFINGKAAARHGDPADACDIPGGTVIATGTVNVG
jgi:uncharacterized Zn-binding protein involved in type VI secretion